MKNFLSAICLVLFVTLTGCDTSPRTQNSDQVQSQLQEQNLQQGTAELGVPSIVNFREKRLLKDLYELRDQNGLVTYTYTWSPMTGKFIFLCNSIGYPFPYSTQYTAPQRPELHQGSSYDGGNLMVPQAEPNGLYPPNSAEGTWVICLSPNGKLQYNGKKILPVYMEPRVAAFPWKLQ